MALALTNLPQDVLILICMHMLIEDVLALMQVIREVFDRLSLTRNIDMSCYACTWIVGLLVAQAPLRLGYPFGHPPECLPCFSLERFLARGCC